MLSAHSVSKAMSGIDGASASIQQRDHAISQDTSGQMVDSEINSQSFHMAELRSERTRVMTLLGVFAGLLILVLIRGITSLAHGHHGQAWPFALLLTLMTAYELLWLRFAKRSMVSRRAISKASWTANIFVESLLPTAALFLQIHVSFIGPQWALASPLVLTYFLFIILSTLHLDPVLSRLTGGFAAAGYVTVSIYAFLQFRDAWAGPKICAYTESIYYSAFLLLGEFAAGAGGLSDPPACRRSSA